MQSLLKECCLPSWWFRLLRVPRRVTDKREERFWYFPVAGADPTGKYLF
jgi:hypothetical protein